MISRITEPVTVPILEQSTHSKPDVVNITTMLANCLPAVPLPTNCLPAVTSPASCLPQQQQQQQIVASTQQQSAECRMPLMVDETLPYGWRRQVKQRKAGCSAGR